MQPAIGASRKLPALWYQWPIGGGSGVSYNQHTKGGAAGEAIPAGSTRKRDLRENGRANPRRELSVEPSARSCLCGHAVAGAGRAGERAEEFEFRYCEPAGEHEGFPVGDGGAGPGEFQPAWGRRSFRGKRASIHYNQLAIAPFDDGDHLRLLPERPRSPERRRGRQHRFLARAGQRKRRSIHRFHGCQPVRGQHQRANLQRSHQGIQPRGLTHG